MRAELKTLGFEATENFMVSGLLGGCRRGMLLRSLETRVLSCARTLFSETGWRRVAHSLLKVGFTLHASRSMLAAIVLNHVPM